MGALTSNRKRGDDSCTWNCKFPFSYSPVSYRRIDTHTHISKKPKTLTSMQLSPDPIPTRSAASRLNLYPKTKQRFRREVHAPRRVSKFGLAASSRPSASSVSRREFIDDDVMGNALAVRLERARKSAWNTFRFLKKEEEVIDVDAETVKDDVSEGSSSEELEIVEDGREGRSVVTDQRPTETNEAVENLTDLDRKVAEHSFLPSSSSAVTDLTNLKLDMDLLQLHPQREWNVPLHKQWLNSVERRRRDDKLNSLHFEIDLYERNLAALQSLHPAKKLVKDEVIEPFVPLTKEEEAEVDLAFSRFNRRKVLVTHENSNIEITGEILQCLSPGAWLNDEVINVYLELLKEREKREPQKFLKCHFFNTFFYKKLISGRSGYDFKSIRRWTTQRKLGYCLFECDKIFVPIHKEIHWCLAVINKKDEKFQYLDSLRGVDKQVMKTLARYFVEEVKDKSGNDIDVGSWKRECVEDLPDQLNGFDCGMFMVKYADFYSRDVGLCFNQEHMPYFRRRTAKEILRLKAE